MVGKPVRKLNTTGLTYCVELQPRARQRLPTRAPLDLDARPPGAYRVPIGQGREQGGVQNRQVKLGPDRASHRGR